MRSKFWVVQEAADKSCQLILTNGGHDNRVVPMSKFRCVKAQVAREEGRLTESAQKDHDLFILQPFAAHIETNLASGDVPALQQYPLSLDNVFVEYDHERKGCSTYSVATYWPA